MKIRNILSIDPGSDYSGIVFFNVVDDRLLKSCKIDNESVQRIIDVNRTKISLVVIEMLSSYGIVGASVFETAIWIGKYIRHLETIGLPWILIKRSIVRGYWEPKNDKLEQLIRDGIITKWPKTTDNKIKLLVCMKYNFNSNIKATELNDQIQALALASYFTFAWKNGKITEKDFNILHTTPKKIKKEKKIRELKK